MSDNALKRRMDRAKAKAFKDLEYLNFIPVPSNNKPVCIVAIQGQDVRLIRICLDEITVADRKTLKDKRYAGLNREIWLRKSGSERFEVHRV